MDKKRIVDTWKKEAKAESKMILLEDLRRGGKAVKDAIKIGKIVGAKKQVPGNLIRAQMRKK